jgi:hypothetical protein
MIVTGYSSRTQSPHIVGESSREYLHAPMLFLRLACLPPCNALDSSGFKEAHMRPAGRLPRVQIHGLPERSCSSLGKQRREPLNILETHAVPDITWVLLAMVK